MGAGDDDRSIRIYQRALNFGSPLPSKCRLFKLVCWRFKQILAKAALKIGYLDLSDASRNRMGVHRRRQTRATRL